MRDLFVPGVNLPTTPDNVHQRVEVCKINGKLVVPAVPPNAREERVFATFPERYRNWAAANDFPPPPTEHWDDVYRGERKIEIGGPIRGERIILGPTIRVTGGASVDDFHHYTLDVGPGENPSTWFTLTDRRPQAVDNGLLGVWNTSSQQPGLYTLRLRVYDSFDDLQEGKTTVTLIPAVSTPQPTASPARSPTPSRTPDPRATATPTPTPKPGG